MAHGGARLARGKGRDGVHFTTMFVVVVVVTKRGKQSDAARNTQLASKCETRQEL